VSDFKVKMYRNRFRLGSAPVSAGGAYSTPRLSGWNTGDLLLRKREGCREGKGRREKRDGKGGESKRWEGSKGEKVCIFKCSLEYPMVGVESVRGMTTR